MKMKPKGALSAAHDESIETADAERAEPAAMQRREGQNDPMPDEEGPAHESSETPAQEGQEGAEGPGDDDAAEEGRAGAGQQKALFDLVVGRALDALSRDGPGLDAALRADPVKATVAYGTQALRTVAQAAQDAGKPIPFDVLVQCGMQVVKELGAVANDKGYLPDEQIPVFLKEAFQQSISKWAQADVQDGALDPRMLKQVIGMGQQGGGALAAAQQQGGA
mgnify:CR=1 FL=1